MQEKEKYTPEQAMEEASRLQEKISEGAKNYREAESKVEMENLIQNPEATLQEFVDTSLSDKREDWGSRLQFNIKNRLDGEPDKRYLFGLRQASTNMDARKEKVLTAALLYELEHQAEIKPIPNYNQTVLFRLCLNLMKERRGFLGETIQKYIDTLPLEEIYKNFRDAKNLVPEDLPMFADMALERSSKEEDNKTAKEVLDKSFTDLFRPTVNTTELKVESFFMPVGHLEFNAERFSPETLNYLLTELKQKEPSMFNELVRQIDERLSNKDINLDEIKSQEELRASHMPYYLKRDQHIALALSRILPSIPVINQPYSELIERRRMQEEKIKAEEEKRAREEVERKAQIEMERKEEEARKDAERERAFREEMRIRKEKANQECELLLKEIPQFEVNNTIFDEQIINRVQTIGIENLGKLWKTEGWAVLQRPGEVVPSMLVGLENKVDALSIGQPIDTEKAENLIRTWRQKSKELEISIRLQLDSKRSATYEVIETRLSFSKANPVVDDYEKYLEMLKQVIKNTEREAGFVREEDERQFLRGIIDIAERKTAEILPVYESIMAQMEESEKKESLDEAKKEYLLNQVEAQIDYLKEIYKIGTGLGLAYVESTAADEKGRVVGSVSVRPRLGHGLRQEIRLAQIITAEDSYLNLEMGEDLDSIKKRLAMVNWVAPHEIAHLVDYSSGISSKLLAGKEFATAEALINNWKGEKPEIAQEMIPSVVKESMIDAIGYRMVKEYGTTNPFDESKTKRIAAALKGFVAMTDVIDHILETRADDEEMKSRYSAILLRMIADGEILIDDAEANKVESELIKEVRQELENFRAVFKKFNQETKFIEKGQEKEIVELCKTFFKKAERSPIIKEIKK